MAATKHWRWLWISDTATTLQELIRLLNERLRSLADFLDRVGVGGNQQDGLYAAEGFLFNAGNVLVAGESDWLAVPTDFTITNAEIVADQAGTISVDVYVANYPAWDPSASRWTKISASAPVVLSGADKAQMTLTGWTKTFTGGRYIRFVVTGTPTLITKATVMLTLSVPSAAGIGIPPSGPAGGVLSGTYPNPTFAVPMATTADLTSSASSTLASAQSYADAKVAGLSWKQAVRAATTVAGTLASSFANASVIDGVTLATGDRILIKNQAVTSENGIYTVNASGAPTRTTDADAGAELVNASVYVSEGTSLADTQWTCSTNAPITVGATGLTFAQLSSGGGSGIGGWDPNGLPVSSSALDAEFNNNTATAWPAGWTAQGGGDFAVTSFPTVTPGRFTTQPTAAGWRGRTAACPAAGTDFILAARVGVVGTGANYTLLGLGLGTTTSQGAGSYLAFYTGYHNGFGGWGIGTDTAGAFQKNWGVIQGINGGLTLYIRRVGTNYYSGWSADGLLGVEDVARTYGFTPTNLHVGCYGDRSGDSYAFIKWVRVISGSGARVDWGKWV